MSVTVVDKARWRGFVPLVVFGVLAVVLGIGLTLNPREVPSPLIGKPAPAFELPGLHDPGVKVSTAGMRGQVWLLNVWASWCAPCREEHPVIVAAARDSGVPVVGLNYKDERDAARGWLRQLGDPYKAIAVDRDGRVGIDWGVYGVPETFVVDRAGVIRHKVIGPMTADAWSGKVLPLIKQLQAERG